MEYKGFYVARMEDCGENEGGFYCQIYRADDSNHDDELDNFCVHPGEDFEIVAKRAVDDYIKWKEEERRKHD